MSRGRPPGRRGAPPARRSPGERPGRGDGREARPLRAPPRRPGPGRGRESHGLGGDQVEGRHAVLELLRAGRRRVHRLVVADDLEPSAQLDEIERLAARRKVRVERVSRGRLETMTRTDAPQGVVARAQPLEEHDLDSLLRGRRGEPPLLLVLEGITDPHNLGALLRTAECAGVTGVVLPRHRAAHVTPTAAKVAAGAIEHVPIAVVPGVPAALARMRDAGVPAVGLDSAADRSLYDLGDEAKGPMALVLGAEGRGLASLTRKRCAALVSIPQHGRLESLNVASAGAVACFEMARRRREPVVGVEPTT